MQMKLYTKLLFVRSAVAFIFQRFFWRNIGTTYPIVHLRLKFNVLSKYEIKTGRNQKSTMTSLPENWDKLQLP